MNFPVAEEVRQGRTVFTILTGSGDDRLVWDKSDPAQVREAIEKFDSYIDNGYIAFLIGEDGQRGAQITKRSWEELEVRQREEILFESPQEVHLTPPLQAG